MHQHRNDPTRIPHAPHTLTQQLRAQLARRPALIERSPRPNIARFAISPGALGSGYPGSHRRHRLSRPIGFGAPTPLAREKSIGAGLRKPPIGIHIARNGNRPAGAISSVQSRKVAPIPRRFRCRRAFTGAFYSARQMLKRDLFAGGFY